MQFGCSLLFRAKFERLAQAAEHIFMKVNIYKGDDGQEHKSSCPSVGRLVGGQDELSVAE